MEMLDFLRDQVRRAWDWLETTVSDVTDEQANWWPPGTANSIGAGYLHTVINPDVEINRLLNGRVPIIERDWAGDVGQGTLYDPDRFDQWTRGVHVQWDRLHRYGRAVHSWLVGSLSELTEADLARPVDMSRAGLGMWTGLDLYILQGFQPCLSARRRDRLPQGPPRGNGLPRGRRCAAHRRQLELNPHGPENGSSGR